MRPGLSIFFPEPRDGTRPPVVGIDLVPAGLRHRAPGTARLVEEQARALFAMNVPWTWRPVVDGPHNPLFVEVQPLHPIIHPVKRVSLYSSLTLGRLWNRAGCDLGFSTAGLVPFVGPPAVANYFDANFYEKVDAWSRRRHWLRHLWLRLLYRHTLSRARTLFILSEHGRQRMTILFPRYGRKFVVTPCGADATASETACVPHWSAKIDRPFFLFVGECSDNKNQRTLLQAWSQLQSAHADAPALILLGPCPAEYRAAVLDPLHRALPRPGEVLMLGFTREAELVWAYRNAIAYIQPSIAEGFGLPVIEAMTFGLPVGCSNTTSLPETVGDAALLFDPSKPDEMVGTALALWRDETLRIELIRRGYQRAKIFRWEHNARIVAREIHSALQRLNRLPPGPIPDYAACVHST